MRLPELEFRARIVRGVRRFLDEAGFLEVETPVRIFAPAPEPHIDCPPCGRGFLRASPELQMKKLLAQGLDKIYQLGPCFREGENGSRHSDEFTMLEWYRKNADYRDLMADMEALIVSLAGPLEFRRLTVREAYRRYAGWDPFERFDQDRFDYDMAVKIEPALAGWTFLVDYPVECASLARISDGKAERWELYHDGLELANAFTELCDGEEQRKRFELARAERRALGEADYPLDEVFLSLLPLVGSAAGVALGIDRLVMAIGEENRISGARVLEIFPEK